MSIPGIIPCDTMVSMPPPITEEQFWSYTVRTSEGCLLWKRATSKNGYAIINRDGSVIGAHLLAAEFAGIDIPDGWEIDHVCHTNDSECYAGNSCLHRRCVEPTHLEPVPKDENARRAHRRTEFCKNGHEFTDKNTKWISRGPDRALSRSCRACDADSTRRYRLRKRMLT